MNQKEREAFDALISDKKELSERAMTLMFFGDGQSSGYAYRTAAQNAVTSQLNGYEYRGISSRTRYETAMVFLIPKLIEDLRKKKDAYLASGAYKADGHWTDFITSPKAYICSILRNYLRKNKDGSQKNERYDIDTALGVRRMQEESIPDETIPGNISLEINPDEGYCGRREEYLDKIKNAISRLKSEKDRELIRAIGLKGLTNGEYAALRNISVSEVNRDIKRARTRLLVLMIDDIRASMGYEVKNFSYELSEQDRTLLQDLVLRDVSFADAARQRGLRTSDVEAMFGTLYNQVIKTYGAVKDAARKDFNSAGLGKQYDKFLKSLVSIGAREQENDDK